MILLATVAFAEELPWECPPITVAADADVYRETDAGLEATFDTLYDAAYAYWDETCAWVETTTEISGGYEMERVCTAADTTVTWVEAATEERDFIYTSADTWSLTVDVPSGETWTTISLTYTDTYSSSTGSSYGGGDTWSASWSGAFSGMPDDGAFVLRYGWSNSMGTTAHAYDVETPTCSWSWRESGDGEYITESVAAPDHRVEAEYGRELWCDAMYDRATIDGVSVGAVVRDTWELDPNDADADGWVAGSCDCDDTDATVYVLAREVPDDGVDQDCTGADLVTIDLDGDGHADASDGGADCDDADATAYPLATEVAGDGVDQDCDGADDIDADADGFTADGDARDPDCDDAEASVYPLATEVECDGIDQDCDGADTCPPPDVPEDTGTDDEEEPSVDEDTAPPEEDGGCTGSAAWLLLTPLLGVRRKGSR